VRNTSAENNSLKVTTSRLRPLYVRSVVNSLGMGVIQPFLSLYAVKLGASSSEMGWFQSLSSLSNNIMQIFWGKLSDRFRKRVPFIAAGSLIIAALWIPMMFVTSVQQLIILIAIQALLGSMATPTWTALIGDLVPSIRLGRTSATVNLWASIGSLIATLLSGVIMIQVGGTPQQMFFIPFLIAMVCGGVSAVVMLLVREKNGRNQLSNKRFLSDILDAAKQAGKTPDFVRYCLVSSIFGFFMSISWPLFSITLVRVLKASMLEIALVSVVQGVSTIAFQSWAGKLADTIGRKPLLVIFRTGLFLVPIAYAFAPSIYLLMLFNVYLGFLTALGQATVTAYILDVTPEENRGSFTAFYNLILGIVFFIGSLVGGYLSDFTIGLFGLTLGLQIAYMISASGRFFGGLTYLTLRETLKKQNSI